MGITRIRRKKEITKMVFPDGFIYDKNNEHIEPKRVNQFFLLKYSYPTDNGDKKKETNRGKHDSSLRVPLTDEILNLWNDFLEIVDYLQSTPQISKIIESI